MLILFYLTETPKGKLKTYAQSYKIQMANLNMDAHIDRSSFFMHN